MTKPIDNIANHAEWSEKMIEKYLRDRVGKLGGLCLKYSSQTQTGYPDRLCIFPVLDRKPQFFFVEVKSKGKRQTRLQLERARELELMGVPVRVAASKADVDCILFEQTRMTP